ncbi:hypothetical protein D8Y20_11525, partial [Mariprofundus sp. EBB-1]|uniref:SPOR domain-containing protein n=1 Tax=Mariprofundus sp. EBB-1 TaxID=2650971 RepID=UPI000F1BF384
DEFLSLNLDEDETPSQDDSLDTLSSLEKELGELTDWVDPELKNQDPEIETTTAEVNETAHLQEPEESTPEAAITPEKEIASATDNTKDEPMTENKKSGLGSRLMLTATLISMLIAALAIWMSLDASQQAANLAQEPVKLQKQMDQMNEHQQKQILLLQQQIENQQQQLKILTNVISNKQSEQWRGAIDNTAVEGKPNSAEPASVSSPTLKKSTEKPVVSEPRVQTSAKKISPAPVAAKSHPVISVKQENTSAKPIIASEYATAPASVQGWVVYLFSTMSQKSAERETRQFRNKKIDAKYLRTISKGKVWYHVLVSGFEDERKAAAFKKFMKEYHGVDSYYNKSANKISSPHAATPVTKAVQHKEKAQAPVSKPLTDNASHSYRFDAVDSEVWLQIFAPGQDATTKGDKLKEVLLKVGHHITIQAASESLWITAGNAPGLSITVDGNVIAKNGSLGTGKKVLRNYRFSIK